MSRKWFGESVRKTSAIFIYMCFKEVKLVYRRLLFIAICLAFIVSLEYYFNNQKATEIDNHTNSNNVENSPEIKYTVDSGRANSSDQISQLSKMLEQNQRKLGELLTHIKLLEEDNKSIHSDIEQLQSQTDSYSLSTEQVSDNSKEDTSAKADTLALFYDVFEREIEDEDWSVVATAKLNHALQTLTTSVEGAQIDQVACQSTVCFASYELPSKDALQQSVSLVGNNLGWESKAYTEYNILPTGEVAVESFYMRENTDFPGSVTDVIE
ncbi:MAG: hypothetical protein P8Y45_20310 [Exilibacterium sp.]